jgi:hypothetical protein
MVRDAGGVALHREPAAGSRRDFWNGARDCASASGHYESWFQRANHPDRPLAFWIRYTIFRPSGRPEDALGELWAVLFDGERQHIVAVKQELPIARCRFARSGIDVAIGDAVLGDARLEGEAAANGHRIGWSLDYDDGAPPLLLLPEALYERPLPRAKALVGSPNARFRGWLEADGKRMAIDGWRGSQNHNWGSRHTDSYAWGQVAGFDDAPGVFLECSTAQLRFGPLWTPRMSLVVLRIGEREVRLNGLGQALRARGRFGFSAGDGRFDWRICSVSRDARIAVHVHVHAPKTSFVGLRYANPPGGIKTCLNSKLASCEVKLETPQRGVEIFVTRHRAAFEILTDPAEHPEHGVSMVV